MFRKSRLLKLLAILFAFALIAAACGDDDDAAPADQPADQPADEPADEPAAEPTDEPADEPAAEPADEPVDESAADEIGPPEVDTLRICQAPSFTGLPAAVAVNQGFLSARGITGEFVQCLSGPANAAALAAGQVDIVANTPDNMLTNIAGGLDVVMFGQVVDTHFFDIVVSNNFGEIDCPQGDWECVMQALDGTNVGVVARGAAAELIAQGLLAAAGLDPDNSTYIATGLSGTTLAALSSGEVDWAITFEPGMTQAEADGIGYLPFSMRNGDFPPNLDFPSLVLTTSRQFWEQAPNAALHYRQAIVEATDWIRDPANRDAVLAEMNALFGAEGELAERLLDNNVASLTQNGVIDPDRIANNVQFAFDNGRIPELYPFERFTVGPDIAAQAPDRLVPETANVRICQAPSFSGLPAAVAVSEGFLEQRGITAEFIACESGPANAAALAAGEVEFVGNTPDNMLGNRAQGLDLVMFGQVINNHFFDILVRADFGDTGCEQGDWECTMQALDGRNVGVVARGAAAEQLARELLDQAGLDPEDSTYIATGLSGTTIAALASGEIDWTITFEPGLSQGVADGIATSPFSMRSGQGPDTLDWPSLVLTTGREFAEANPNTLKLYRDAIRDAMAWIRQPQNREAVLAEMAELIGVEGELAEAILDNNVGGFSIDAKLQRDRIENNVAYAVGRGLLEEAPAYEDFTFSVD